MSLTQASQILSPADYHNKLIELENRVKTLENDNANLKAVCANCIKTTNESIEVVKRAETTLFKAVKLIRTQKQIIDQRDDY